MEDIYSQPLIEMGVRLSELAVKGTVSAVGKRIKAAKEIKDAEKIRTTYDEIVNEVLQEREEAIRIAQMYKAEYERLIISDEDIQHLHLTVSRVLELLKAFSPEMPFESFEALKELISVDTLKTMQLLGFNYKAAIGEPLTQLCAEKINSLSNKNLKTNQKKNNTR